MILNHPPQKPQINITNDQKVRYSPHLSMRVIMSVLVSCMDDNERENRLFALAHLLDMGIISQTQTVAEFYKADREERHNMIDIMTVGYDPVGVQYMHQMYDALYYFVENKIMR